VNELDKIGRKIQMIRDFAFGPEVATMLYNEQLISPLSEEKKVELRAYATDIRDLPTEELEGNAKEIWMGFGEALERRDLQMVGEIMARVGIIGSEMLRQKYEKGRMN